MFSFLPLSFPFPSYRHTTCIESHVSSLHSFHHYLVSVPRGLYTIFFILMREAKGLQYQKEHEYWFSPRVIFLGVGEKQHFSITPSPPDVHTATAVLSFLVCFSCSNPIHSLVIFQTGSRVESVAGYCPLMQPLQNAVAWVCPWPSPGAGGRPARLLWPWPCSAASRLLQNCPGSHVLGKGLSLRRFAVGGGGHLSRWKV